MANDIAALCRPSADGSMVSVCQLGEFYTVSYFATGRTVSAPQNMFFSASEALTYARRLLDEHPDAGFEAPCCMQL
ncbi:MAG: hypothetical protein IKT07_09820 [Oscillospiraceae bacterium]|nr:hypothetical protein [Oscillospiraceae bacterium]